MEAKSLILFVVVAGLALILLGSFIDYVGFYNGASGAVTNESFTISGRNNTCIYPARGPVDTITAIYTDAADTAANATPVCGTTGCYINPSVNHVCDGGFKVWTNATYPTVGNPSTWYISYTQAKPSGLASVVVGFIVAIFLLVVILRMFHYI